MEQFPNSVMLTSRDMKASVAFYRDQLGFELKECFPDAEAPRWANLVMNGQSLMIGEAMASLDDAPPMPGREDLMEVWKERHEAFQGNAPGAGVAIYIQVGDVDAYHDIIRGRGVEPRTRPADEFFGIRDFMLVDPDGYHLVIYKPITLSTCQLE